MILEALTTTVMMLIILFLLPFVERAILPHASPSTHHLFIEALSISGQFIANIYDICMRNKVTIEKLHLQAVKESETLGIICRIPSEESQPKSLANCAHYQNVSPSRQTCIALMVVTTPWKAQ